MSLPSKQVLPDIYLSEFGEYSRLSTKINRTTTGNVTFTSASSGVTYNTASSPSFANQGEQGLALMLYNETPILKNYIFDNETYGAMVNRIALTTSQSEVKTAGGTATVITLSGFGLSAYFTGLKVTFVASANNNSAATTINIDGRGAKSIYKPNTTTAPKFVAGRAYTIYYNGTSFFWQASAEGDAVVANVLAGKTFSNDDDTGLVGTMVDRAGDTAAVSIARSGTTIRLRASEGYRDGTNDFVTHADANDIAANIRTGVVIRGLTGTLRPREHLAMPTSLGNANYQLMQIDEDYNTYWGSKWVYTTYEVRNKAGTLVRTVSISAGETHRLLGCGSFGYTKNKSGNNGIVQHYQENGTFIREFTKGVTDNADPYLFNGNGYAAVVDGSPQRNIARWNASGTFIASTQLNPSVSINGVLNTHNYIVFPWSYSSLTFQFVKPDNTIGSMTYTNNVPLTSFFDYINFKL